MALTGGSLEYEGTNETGFTHRLRRRIPLPTKRRTRIVLVAVLSVVMVLILLVATIGIAWIGGDGQEGPGTSPYIEVTSLEPFEINEQDGVYTEVGWEWSSGDFDFLTWEFMRDYPSTVGQVFVFFIDHFSLRIHWRDEPDASGFLWGYENQPDTMKYSISDNEGWIDFTQEVTNVHGEEAEIRFDWQGNGTYFAVAFYHEEEDTWAGVDGWEYIQVNNESVSWNNRIDDTVQLVEAGDQVHERFPIEQNDNGNEIFSNLVVSGYLKKSYD